MKYIIELEKIDGTDLYRAKGSRTLVFDEYGIKNILTPYEDNSTSILEDGDIIKTPNGTVEYIFKGYSMNGKVNCININNGVYTTLGSDKVVFVRKGNSNKSERWGDTNNKEAERNIARVVDLKELGVDVDTFEKIYRMGEEDGRTDQKAYCESCIHKVTKADIDAIEATARAHERVKVLEYITSNYMVCTSDGSCADYVDLMEETEHRLKEQKNE